MHGEKQNTNIPCRSRYANNRVHSNGPRTRRGRVRTRCIGHRRPEAQTAGRAAVQLRTALSRSALCTPARSQPRSPFRLHVQHTDASSRNGPSFSYTIHKGDVVVVPKGLVRRGAGCRRKGRWRGGCRRNCRRGPHERWRHAGGARMRLPRVHVLQAQRGERVCDHLRRVESGRSRGGGGGGGGLANCVKGFTTGWARAYCGDVRRRGSLPGQRIEEVQDGPAVANIVLYALHSNRRKRTRSGVSVSAGISRRCSRGTRTSSMRRRCARANCNALAPLGSCCCTDSERPNAARRWREPETTIIAQIAVQTGTRWHVTLPSNQVGHLAFILYLERRQPAAEKAPGEHMDRAVVRAACRAQLSCCSSLPIQDAEEVLQQLRRGAIRRRGCDIGPQPRQGWPALAPPVVQQRGCCDHIPDGLSACAARSVWSVRRRSSCANRSPPPTAGAAPAGRDAGRGGG